MAQYVIKNINCGLTAMGLCADTVNIEVEFQNISSKSKKSVFISAVEFEGMPNIYKTTKSVYARLMNGGAESEAEADNMSREELEETGYEFFDEMNSKHAVYQGEGYQDFYDDKKCGGTLHEAIRFVIYALRCSWDELNKKEYNGKVIGTFEIPKCDVEHAWEQGVSVDELDDEEEQ